MAWSETMIILDHFYNAFQIDERVTNLEQKISFVARSVNGKPENIDIEKLAPGTLWFIKDDNDPNLIKSLSILTEDKTFSEPILFQDRTSYWQTLE